MPIGGSGIRMSEKRTTPSIPNRRKGWRETSAAAFHDQVGVRVVHHLRHVGLALGVGEEHVRRREGDDFHVDADPIHVFDALRHVGHRRRDAEETRAVIGDDRAAGRIGRERELAARSLIFERTPACSNGCGCRASAVAQPSWAAGPSRRERRPRFPPRRQCRPNRPSIGIPDDSCLLLERAPDYTLTRAFNGPLDGLRCYGCLTMRPCVRKRRYSLKVSVRRIDCRPPRTIVSDSIDSGSSTISSGSLNVTGL